MMRRWLVALVVCVSAVPAVASLDDTTLWAGYEMVRVPGGDMIIRPTRPNPPGDPPLASARLLAKDIASYDRVAKRSAEKPGFGVAERAGLALGFLKLVAFNEVSTSGNFPGQPNAHRPVREAIEKALNVTSRVVVDRAPGLSKKGYKADYNGKEPGRGQLAKFDEFVGGLVSGLERMEQEIARRESEGVADPPEARPSSVARSVASDAPPAAAQPPGQKEEAGWSLFKGEQVYQPPNENPGGEPPFEFLSSLHKVLVDYNAADAEFKKNMTAISDGAEERARNAPAADKQKARAHARNQIDVAWKGRGEALLKQIAVLEAHSGQSAPDVNNPFRTDREQLEIALGLRVRVFRDNSKTGGVPKLYVLDGARQSTAADAGAFKKYMAKRLKDLLAIKAKVEQLKGQSEE